MDKVAQGYKLDGVRCAKFWKTWCMLENNVRMVVQEIECFGLDSSGR
jgi:hypothetical protein